ncbi:hypothetical protein J4E80_008955 [Alternaria sp. BMP 0032]|nr:hypothetical protein J4E80_008955 [Alternaria sp. BMP 0032]
MHILHLSTLLVLAVSTNGLPSLPSGWTPCYLPKRLIALEEHVVSPSLEAEVIAGGVVQRNPSGTLHKLKDVGAGRITAMNAGHLSMQVVAQQSASGVENPEGCRAANDAVRSVIVSRPTRFAGFAVLPMSLPEEAAAELNRSVTTLGFKGAMIGNHLDDGTYYDAARFDPIFAMAQNLDVPLYLHSATPTADIAFNLYVGGAGLSDRFPKLKLIIGHDGEGLPMFIDRIDSTGPRSDTTFDRVWKTNIWSTTCAFFNVRQFEQLKQCQYGWLGVRAEVGASAGAE